MAMSLDMPNGGDIKYMIWDDTDTNLLFSDIVAVGASGTTSYVLSNPFSFTLNAGSTYFFGVIGDNNLNIDFIFPPTTVTQNGLTTLDTGNTNYLTFASPTPTDGGGVTFTLQLFGDQGSAVPEPSTWMLVSGGVGLIAFFRRKRAAVN
jgi:hypothetical protein